MLTSQNDKDSFELWLSKLSEDLSGNLIIGFLLEPMRNPFKTTNRLHVPFGKRCNSTQTAVKLGPTCCANFSESTRPSDLASQYPSNRSSKLGDLSKLQQQRDRFDRTGRNSRQVVAEMADTLVRLGRIWEAEAWTAVAIVISR